MGVMVLALPVMLVRLVAVIEPPASFAKLTICKTVPVAVTNKVPVASGRVSVWVELVTGASRVTEPLPEALAWLISDAIYATLVIVKDSYPGVEFAVCAVPWLLMTVPAGKYAVVAALAGAPATGKYTAAMRSAAVILARPVLN